MSMELHSSREQAEGDMHDDRMPHDDDDDSDCIDGLSSSTKLVVVLMVMGASSLTFENWFRFATSEFDQPCGVE